MSRGRTWLPWLGVVAILAGASSGWAGQRASPAQPVEVQPFFLALSVADLDASAAWYERVLGFTTARRAALPDRGVRVAILERSGALLELVEQAAAMSPSALDPPVTQRALLLGVFKAGFAVDDLDLAIRRLETLGVSRRGGVITEPDGSLRSVQIEDPDGNILQLFETSPPE